MGRTQSDKPREMPSREKYGVQSEVNWPKTRDENSSYRSAVLNLKGKLLIYQGKHAPNLIQKIRQKKDSDAQALTTTVWQLPEDVPHQIKVKHRKEWTWVPENQAAITEGIKSHRKTPGTGEVTGTRTDWLKMKRGRMAMERWLGG